MLLELGAIRFYMTSRYGHRKQKDLAMNQPFVMGYTGSARNACTHDYVLGNGYRWYNPALMRFMSSDDWSPFGAGGVNSYAYCADDPINFSDPSGHAPWSWFRKMARRVRAAFPTELAKRLDYIARAYRSPRSNRYRA